MITLRVDGEPAPQGSKSIVSRGGRTWMIEKSRKVGPWRDAIKAAAMVVWREQEPEFGLPGAQIAPAAGPLGVSITFWLKRPRAHYRTGRNAHLLKDAAPQFPATRPDLDKLIRSTLDGLKAGGIYGDDGQVVEVTAVKLYCNGNSPGARIRIRSAGRADHDPQLGR